MTSVCNEESRFRSSVVNSKKGFTGATGAKAMLVVKKKKSSVQGGLLRSSKLCAPGAYKEYKLMILGDNWRDRITRFKYWGYAA